MKINDDTITALWSEEEAGFYWSGCDNCNNHLGNNCYESKASFFNASTNTWEHYDIKLCSSCIMAYEYGEALDDECKNKFNI